MVDPWIDGLIAAKASHGENFVVAQVKGETHSHEHNDHQLNIDAMGRIDAAHTHGDCPESCPDHTCHLGHCHLLLESKYFSYFDVLKMKFSERILFVPLAPTDPLRRPPKTHA